MLLLLAASPKAILSTQGYNLVLSSTEDRMLHPGSLEVPPNRIKITVSGLGLCPVALWNSTRDIVITMEFLVPSNCQDQMESESDSHLERVN